MERTIGIFTCDEWKYIISIWPLNTYLKTQVVPQQYWSAKGISIGLTNKSAKKIRNYKGRDARYRLFGYTFNMAVMRTVEKCIAEYLDEQKPQYLFVSAYEDGNEKRRLDLYLRRLKKYNYYEVWREGDENPYVVLERR